MSVCADHHFHESIIVQGHETSQRLETSQQACIVLNTFGLSEHSLLFNKYFKETAKCNKSHANGAQLDILMQTHFVQNLK